jgi:hypothetical protein
MIFLRIILPFYFLLERDLSKAGLTLGSSPRARFFGIMLQPEHAGLCHKSEA